ncbi:MAG: DNA polymerase III subunit gamma/tau [Flavobacteriales bacterium]|jgi:DNA polymerase-3 subunit gamma/tau
MAENFIVSARKYRPDNWDTVVGQKSITATLQNAIATNQIAQSYLFCGPRGVGKTSCARIFARAVNEAMNDSGIDLSFNIFELDAASNNSVDDIRSIVDSVRIPPQQGRFKVYIIDEVHMLSSAAFNAFLKTLEEPPAHAIFILATTEKHKIIPTILSRCQIFDFNRIKVKDMTEHLASIASREGITAEMDALHVIAQKADGAMRDALSIFDQVVAFCGRNLTYQLVIQNLNVLDYDYYFKLTDAVLQEDISAALLLFDEVLNKGFDAHHFITGIGSHFRNLLVCKDPETIKLLEVSDNVANRYQEQGAAADLRLLIQGLDFINECDIQYRGSKHPRLLVELTLMRLCSIPYNNREGEKKKFKLIPFRGGERQLSASNTSAAKPSGVISTAPKQSPTPVPTPAPATVVTSSSVSKEPVTMGKKSLLGMSKDSVSIKTLTRKSNEDTEKAVANEAAAKEVADREYSLSEIQNAWNSFVEHRLQNNMQVKMALKVAVLELKSGSLLRVAFPSETQQIYFNDCRADLGDFMRNEFGIKGLDFELDLQRQTEVKLSTRTDKEKFDAMRAKNPSVDLLRQTFQLRVD